MRVGVALLLLSLCSCGRWGYDGDGYIPCLDGDSNFVDPDTGNCYMSFDTALTWDDAVAACASLGHGAHLATLTSATENDRVSRAMLLSEGGTYLGASDRNIEGVFEWITAEPMAFTSWESSQPDDSGGAEDCLQFFPDGTWNDIGCAEPYPYLCERQVSGSLPPCEGGDMAAIDPGTGGCFLLFLDGLSWPDALAACDSLGDGFHLATISYFDENEAVRTLVSTIWSAWIGANDGAAEGYYEWITGEDMSFWNWEADEPNNGDGGNEDCMEFYATGTWNDAECTDGQAYVCERD